MGQIITQSCGLEGCDGVLKYEYKGWGRKRKYCSDACRKAAKKAQDGSRDRKGERQRIRATRQTKRLRSALRAITDDEIRSAHLRVQGEPKDLPKGPRGPNEGQTVIYMPLKNLSDHEWFKANPDWDKDL